MVQGTRHDQTMVCHGDVVAVWLQEAADIFPLCLHRVVGNVEEGVVISNSVRDETGRESMHCLRCHGLMMTIWLEDAASSTGCFSGWRCLLCGEVVDFGIKANRQGRQGPVRSGARPPGTVPGEVGMPRYKGLQIKN